MERTEELTGYFAEQTGIALALRILDKEGVFSDMSRKGVIREQYSLGKRIGEAFELNQEFASLMGEDSPDFENFFNLSVPTYVKLSKQLRNDFWGLN